MHWTGFLFMTNVIFYPVVKVDERQNIFLNLFLNIELNIVCCLVEYRKIFEKSIIFGLKPKTCEWYADVTTEGYEHGNTLGLYRCYHYGLFMWSHDFTYNDKEWCFFLRKIGFGKTWVLTLRHPTNPCRREADQRFAGTSVVKHKEINISKRTSFQSRLSFLLTAYPIRT